MQLEVALSDLQSLCRDTTALSVVADTCQPCLPASPGAVCGMRGIICSQWSPNLGHFVCFLLPSGRILIAEGPSTDGERGIATQITEYWL